MFYGQTDGSIDSRCFGPLSIELILAILIYILLCVYIYVCIYIYMLIAHPTVYQGMCPITGTTKICFPYLSVVVVVVLVTQSCLTLCDPMDCHPPDCSVHGILQARIPEWVAIPFSRGSFQPRD